MLTTPQLSPVVEFDSSTRPQEFHVALDRYIASYRDAQRDRRRSAPEARSLGFDAPLLAWLRSRFEQVS